MSTTSTPDATIEEECLSPSCGNKGALKCSACKIVRFCSRECQKELWKAHKHFCKSTTQTATCLLLVGMGPLGSNDVNLRPIQEVLASQGLTSTAIHVNKGKLLPAQIAALLRKNHEIRVCIVLGWGSGDDGLGDEFGAREGPFHKEIVDWVAVRGGRFLVNGERIAHAAGDWPKWFGLDWASHDYYRTTHVRNPHHWALETGWWPTDQTKSLPLEMNVKSSMIKGVAPEDILFGTTEGSVSYSPVPGFGGHPIQAGQAAFALARYGEGTVGFFGDVNAESSTIATIGIVAQGGNP